MQCNYLAFYEGEGKSVASHSLEPGNCGHRAIRPHSVDESEVTHVERTVGSRGQARWGEKRHLVGVPFTPVAAHHLPLLSRSQQGGDKTSLLRQVYVLTIALL